MMLLLWACAPSPAEQRDAALTPTVVEARVLGHPLWLELAVTDAQKARGLSGRRSLGDEEGMLFIEERPREMAFWMHDTYLPLTIAFLDENLVIVEVMDMAPMDESEHRSSFPAQAALELPQGWLVTHGVPLGTPVEVELGK